MKYITDKINTTLNGFKVFFKKFGVWAIVALIVWLSPSWLALFIPALKPFAVKWLALVVSPIVPSWAAVPLLAVILKLLYQGILWLIQKIKDWAMKARYGAELVTLFDVSEVEIILNRGRDMKLIKDKQKREFNKTLNDERKKLITEHWELTLAEAENKELNDDTKMIINNFKKKDD